MNRMGEERDGEIPRRRKGCGGLANARGVGSRDTMRAMLSALSPSFGLGAAYPSTWTYPSSPYSNQLIQEESTHTYPRASQGLEPTRRKPWAGTRRGEILVRAKSDVGPVLRNGQTHGVNDGGTGDEMISTV